ncbi:hypothetical protein KKG58_03945 [Patescibacteria group bacterium]|nr:hypothetical protein [Patescibacteria group bacterium]
MKLQKFIKYLQEIRKNHNDNIEVVMADGVSIVEPIFFNDYNGKTSIVITDEKKTMKI